MRNVLKKNQLIILVIALMLVTAGYLNYTSGSNIIETSTSIEETKDYASIGDATLVNSKDIITDEDKQEIENIIQEAQTSNDTKETSTNTVEEVEATVDTNTTIKDEDDYFTESKLERDKMYSQMLETYQKILESTNISQEQKAISEQEITKINQTKNAIMIAENLISTKGFENSVIFVNDSSVSVVVKAETLQDEQIAQIQNIISRELNAEVENIHISNK